jgi:hypothetical protein
MPTTDDLIPLSSTATGAISWHAPVDGGTPREPSRVIIMSPCQFFVRARVEEPANPLNHAASRMDVVCRNSGSRSQTIHLHVDVSDDGRRTNADDNVWGGMPLRDFLFIRRPDDDWRQVNGSVAGWVCSVRFDAPPGDTRVGLSPHYNYGDMLRYVRSLPEHPHLTKTLLGRSDGGREHWGLTVTDPSASKASKRRVFLHAREHAYECFSSFAVEGFVAALLSDEGEEWRQRFAVTVHPMTNPDGVADGFEYRYGYDYPDARETTSARLTFETVDRLRPDYVVTWHNWIAPRDTDCAFYTDDEDGAPTRRAWDAFTQRFPTPRRFAHRWDSEANPLRANWAGRKMNPDSNVHQYALSRHGSRVWGWEMPWWNRTVEDARNAGAAFARAFFATIALIEATPAVARAIPNEVVAETPLWEKHEFVVRAKTHVENPFRDAALVGEFTSPTGRSVSVAGFFDGDETWRLRFSPDEQGLWTYRLRGEGIEAHETGRLSCVEPTRHGFIHVHPENPYAFSRSDGTPFFPMGDTCYGLYADSPVTPELRTQYLKTRRDQGFNWIRMGVYHSPTHGQQDPAFWPWGGTFENPDYDRLNPTFFRGLDAVFNEMDALGLNAELLVLSFYQRPFTDTRLWTTERERLWLRYLMARYSAYPNIFLWTLANEYETHPDGDYRLDLPGDVDWAKRTARFLKAHDPYGHLVGTHPVISASTIGSRPPDPYDPPWRIGKFFGEGDALDVLIQQTVQAGTWDETLQCWQGDDPYLAASLRADRRYKKPVLNAENGYEYLRGHPTSRRQVHHTDKVRRSSWRIACSGGYFSAGFAGTVGHSDFWNQIDAPNRYPFVIRDEGAATHLRILKDFFAVLPYWRMSPFDGVTGDAVALAEPAVVYVVYFPHGGKAAVDLNGAEGAFSARWFDPRSGSYGELFAVNGGGRVELTAPNALDWTLLLFR